MKSLGGELERKAREALRSCLSRVPFLEIEDFQRQTSQKAVRPDFLVKLAVPEGDKVLVVEIKANGQPRVAREAVNQILRYRDLFPDSYGIFLAPYISPKAGEICRQEGIGYLDLAGNCYLCFDGVYIEQEGKPNVFKEKRDLRSLYSPKAERVLRVLLINPGKSWKVEELAKEAEVSLGQVSNVKKLLMDREWIQADKAGFMMNEREQLLSEWQANYSFRRNKIQDFYSLGGPGQIEADLVEYCNREKVKYAFTGFSGAARFAPSVRYQRAMAYLEDLDEGVLPQLALKKVTTGANVSIFLPYDEGVFYGAREVGGAQVASPLQVYLDVRSFRGRGEEAAQVLLEQVIRPAW
ncbi:MAG: hypothetical protein KKE57_10040 [Proteobacteria bacterium]|nr:hypothetical protein [Pseudomonadota bacterium]